MDDIGPALGRICADAARMILPYWRAGLAVERKSDDSPVTEADRNGEALIVSERARLLPDIPVRSRMRSPRPSPGSSGARKAPGAVKREAEDAADIRSREVVLRIIRIDAPGAGH